MLSVRFWACNIDHALDVVFPFLRDELLAKGPVALPGPVAGAHAAGAGASGTQPGVRTQQQSQYQQQQSAPGPGQQQQQRGQQPAASQWAAVPATAAGHAPGLAAAAGAPSFHAAPPLGPGLGEGPTSQAGAGPAANSRKRKLSQHGGGAAAAGAQGVRGSGVAEWGVGPGPAAGIGRAAGLGGSGAVAFQQFACMPGAQVPKQQ